MQKRFSFIARFPDAVAYMTVFQCMNDISVSINHKMIDVKVMCREVHVTINLDCFI